MYSAAEQKSEGGKEAQDSFHVPRSIQMICGTAGSDEDPTNIIKVSDQSRKRALRPDMWPRGSLLG